jgi:hypothetical protein
MVTKKRISDSHGKKTACLIAPCARWFNCFLGVDKIDTLSVGNVSSAVLKGSMAGEEPITAWQRWAYDVAREPILPPQSHLHLLLLLWTLCRMKTLC